MHDVYDLVYLSTEAYDKLQADLVKARESLTKILTSKDIKATVCTLLLITVLLCYSFKSYTGQGTKSSAQLRYFYLVCSYWRCLSKMSSIGRCLHF